MQMLASEMSFTLTLLHTIQLLYASQPSEESRKVGKLFNCKTKSPENVEKPFEGTFKSCNLLYGLIGMCEANEEQ